MSTTSEPLKVAIIDDDRGKVENLKKDLKYLDCWVVAIAYTLDQALNDLIPRLEALGVAFVFLDNSVSKVDDGREIATAIRVQVPDKEMLKIIGFSASSQDYVDVPLSKIYWGFKPLRKALGLPEE